MAQHPIIEAHLSNARPRVISALMRRFQDLDMAEDGFQIAALRAIDIWSNKGVPEKPENWLVRVGHNALVDSIRKEQRYTSLKEDDTEQSLAHWKAIGDVEASLDAALYKDDILQMLFLCCHPQLSETDQMLLCLRHILGLAVKDLARAFLITSDTAQRRISRARQRANKIGLAKAEGVAPTERRQQLDQIRAALYLMFNKGYAASHGENHLQPLLCGEALRLTRLLLQLVPQESETMGLLSLMLGLAARFSARLNADGHLVPLDKQDRTLWDRGQIEEARVLVQKSLRSSVAGPYSIQAAIGDLHNSASTASDTDWKEILRLYMRLEHLSPTAVIKLNRLVAQAKADKPEAVLDELSGLSEALSTYLPYHAACAGLFEEAGDMKRALDATILAMACNPSAEERTFLSKQKVRLEKNIAALSE